MKCNYPNCPTQASLKPVIAIPTFRTVGLHKPTLDRQLLNHPTMLTEGGFERGQVIREYEAATAEYNATVNDTVKTKRPTFLIGTELCMAHSKTYKFTDWFKSKDWRIIQEVGRQKGFHVPEPHLLVIEWKPLTWTPQQGYMEIER